MPKAKLVFVDESGRRHELRHIRSEADVSFVVTLDDSGEQVTVNEEGEVE